MSEDEMAQAVRRSPRKGADGQPVMAADAAKNILQNKKTRNKREAPETTTVGTKAGNKKKGKTTPIPEEVATLPEEDDANNFEPNLHTEGEKKKLVEAKNFLEAKRGHVKAITVKPNDGKIMRDARRNEPERLKAAAKKQHDQEVYDQQLNDKEKQAGILSPPASDGTDDSNSDEDATTKKKDA